MTMHLIMTVLASEQVAEGAKEALTWWQEGLEMVQSPAHWLSEGLIELGLGVIGWHTVGKLTHHGKVSLLKGLKQAILRAVRFVRIGG